MKSVRKWMKKSKNSAWKGWRTNNPSIFLSWFIFILIKLSWQNTRLSTDKSIEKYSPTKIQQSCCRIFLAMFTQFYDIIPWEWFILAPGGRLVCEWFTLTKMSAYKYPGTRDNAAWRLSFLFPRILKCRNRTEFMIYRCVVDKYLNHYSVLE